MCDLFLINSSTHLLVLVYVQSVHAKNNNAAVRDLNVCTLYAIQSCFNKFVLSKGLPRRKSVEEHGICEEYSGNINPDDDGNCDAETGECLKCLFNTERFNFEKCAVGYFTCDKR